MKKGISKIQANLAIIHISAQKLQIMKVKNAASE